MSKDQNYEVFKVQDGKPIKAWIKGVPLEPQAKEQLINTSRMPFIYKHLAVMPDCHLGKGATVGSVIATQRAIIPAAVGVDIGCGMAAVKTTMNANQLPDNLHKMRMAIEKVIPVGQSSHDEKWDRTHPAKAFNKDMWGRLEPGYRELEQRHPELFDKLSGTKTGLQVGTLGGGNHFIEVLYDEDDTVWLMLHSGSRGIGNKIGQHFINLARKEMESQFINLPDKDLSYLVENGKHFDDYVRAVSWAQDYASKNRTTMMMTLMKVLKDDFIPDIEFTQKVVNCHHNYISKEHHFGENVYVTRKGAVSAKEGEWGIIPGSMGTGSFIVQGKGNVDSFHSCSHGAGRVMSRGKAKEMITLEQHAEATKGVECRKDSGILDESPAAYKDLIAVMAAQDDLIEIKHRLLPLLCIKG